MEKEIKYRYFIELRFDGTNYHGWQIQPNANSIQQTLQTALSTLLKENTELTGSGRTDTGVHATHFTAHFDSKSTPEKIKRIDLVYKLNRILPPDIAIINARQVNKDAHARYSALSRSYEYFICRRKDPFFINRAWPMERKLDFDAMQKATEILFEYNDFEAFTKANTQVNHFKCNILYAEWCQEGHIWKFRIKADRFLRNMVRAIVGTITDVGLGKITVEKMKEIIESKNRSNAGYSVPGCGLYFIGAEYPPEIYL
ncbi:MAG: tRNA pseudouridine(38-40) synthase TruA [Bacteroidetes bacterium]|nr:MAG: tRNA pseudouridine(38-40) synthase TruA [Bacteroidota bacterium]